MAPRKHANATSFGGSKGNTPNGGRVVSNPAGRNSTYEKRMRFLAERFARSERWLRLSDPQSECSDTDFIRAAREVWDRTRGRPAQSVDITSQGRRLPGVIVLPAELPETDG